MYNVRKHYHHGNEIMRCYYYFENSHDEIFKNNTPLNLKNLFSLLSEIFALGVATIKYELLKQNYYC